MKQKLHKTPIYQRKWHFFSVMPILVTAVIALGYVIGTYVGWIHHPQENMENGGTKLSKFTFYDMDASGCQINLNDIHLGRVSTTTGMSSSVDTKANVVFDDIPMRQYPVETKTEPDAKDASKVMMHVYLDNALLQKMLKSTKQTPEATKASQSDGSSKLGVFA